MNFKNLAWIIFGALATSCASQKLEAVREPASKLQITTLQELIAQDQNSSRKFVYLEGKTEKREFGRIEFFENNKGAVQSFRIKCWYYDTKENEVKLPLRIICHRLHNFSFVNYRPYRIYN